MILTTERLILRKITHEDRDELYKFLGDIEVLYAWGHTFSYCGVSEWIEKNLNRYEKNDMGYYLVVKKKQEKKLVYVEH